MRSRENTFPGHARWYACGPATLSGDLAAYPTTQGDGSHIAFPREADLLWALRIHAELT